MSQIFLNYLIIFIFGFSFRSLILSIKLYDTIKLSIIMKKIKWEHFTQLEFPKLRSPHKEEIKIFLKRKIVIIF